jgi:hypothetical protein
VPIFALAQNDNVAMKSAKNENFSVKNFPAKIYKSEKSCIIAAKIVGISIRDDLLNLWH